MPDWTGSPNGAVLTPEAWMRPRTGSVASGAYGIDPQLMWMDPALLPGGRSEESGYGPPTWMYGPPRGVAGMAGSVPGMGAEQAQSRESQWQTQATTVGTTVTASPVTTIQMAPSGVTGALASPQSAPYVIALAGLLGLLGLGWLFTRK